MKTAKHDEVKSMLLAIDGKCEKPIPAIVANAMGKRIKDLESGLRKILDSSDSKMADGDYAREIAEELLK